jgi:hypothetical protein
MSKPSKSLLTYWKKTKQKNNNNNLHVTQFVSYGEGGAESVVLNDRTRIGAVTHGAEFGQSQRVAFLHLRIPANVFPVNSRAVSVVPAEEIHKQLFSICSANLVSRRAVS